MIYFTSDFHFGHDREFIYGPRGFASVGEMNQVLVMAFNSVVQWDDDVYVLGDLLLGDDSALRYLKQLNGRLHIIRGNHDTERRMELYENLHHVVEVCGAKYLRHEGYSFFLCHYPALTANYDDGKKLTRCTINICGHTHTKDKFADMDKGLIYHVEVDAHENKPVSIRQVIEDLEARCRM